MMLKMGALKTMVPFVLLLAAVCSTAESLSAQEIDSSARIQKVSSRFDASFAKFIKDGLKPEENAVFSPFNIQVALSLLQLGTSGETRDELSNFLEIPNNETESAEQHSYLGKVLNDLQTTDAAEVKIANSAFVQKGLKLRVNYLQATKNYYKSEAQQVDFAKGGSEATDTINDWVSSNTKKRIPKLFKNNISSSTRVLLASALLFNATWQHPFRKYATKDEKFNTGVKQIAIKMMNQIEYVPYLKNEELQFEAISIPYKNNEFSMDIILPYKSKTLGAAIEELTVNQLRTKQELHAANASYVDYKLPRFKFDWSQNINNLLQKSGINKIFTNSELNNLIENSENLKVSDVNHAAEIQVDEDGTIATAVTTIGVNIALSSKPKPIEFHVDRPFFFRIVSRKAGVILFTGIVQNPAE